MSQTIIDSNEYVNTYQLLKKAVEGLNKEQLKWKEAPDKWSVTEVVSHLVDHNIIVSFRIREILSDSQERLPGFNQDAWVAGSKANEGSVADTLTIFHALLVYNSQLFTRLSAKDWEKTGVNFQGETIRLIDVVQLFIKHVHRHLNQIDRIKTAIGVR